MVTHFEILIDASGSMGKDVQASNGDSHLLPDGSSRMDLTKKILLNNIVSSLKFTDFINISIFRVNLKKDKDGHFIKGDKNQYFLDRKVFDSIYKGKFEEQSIIKEIEKLNDPEIGSTPLNQAVSNVIYKYRNYDGINILVISDGDASDEVEFDVKLIEKIKKYKVTPIIYFIGIDQDTVAQQKSKRLVEFTKGKYVNVKAIDYDKALFDNFLFEVKTSITQDAISASIAQNIPVSKTQEKAKIEIYQGRNYRIIGMPLYNKEKTEDLFDKAFNNL